MSARVEGDSQINPLHGNTEQTASQKDVQNNGRAIKYHSKISGGKQFGYILAAVFSFGLALISKGCRQGCNGYKVSKFEMSEDNFETKGKLEGMKHSELKQLAVAVFKKESKQDPAYQAPSLKDIEYETLVNTLTTALQNIRERKEPVEESEDDSSISEGDIDEVEDDGRTDEEKFRASLKNAVIQAFQKLGINPLHSMLRFRANKELYIQFLNEVRLQMANVLSPNLANTPVENWGDQDLAFMINQLNKLK